MHIYTSILIGNCVVLQLLRSRTAEPLDSVLYLDLSNLNLGELTV